MTGRSKRRGRAYNAGAWQVARERLRLEQYYPDPAFKEPVQAGEMLKGILDKFGIEDQAWMTELLEVWPELVGKAVATHTRPGTFKDGRLVVFVDSSVWLSELSRFGKKQMLEKLQGRYGAGRIRLVDLRLDPEPGRAR